MTERKSVSPHTDLTAPGVLKDLLSQNIIPALLRKGVGSLEDEPMRVNGSTAVYVFIPSVNGSPEERFEITLIDAAKIVTLRSQLHEIATGKKVLE